jgi:septal ring factor EnvC (AmiA/AmiB activator)
VPATAQLKSDLAEALRSNSSLQSRLKNAEAEVQRLRTKTMQDAKALDKLNRERTLLSQKTKDRDEELRGKAKFLDVSVVLRVTKNI